MAREALLLDSNDDLTIQMSRILVDNGYVIRILATKERVKQFEKIPVYIHLLIENYEKILKEIDFEKIEVAIFPSPNDMLNLTFARAAKSQGVPIVIITARNNAVAKQAEEEGIEVVMPYHCVISRLLRMLNLKFTRIIPLKGEVAILEMLVTSDSKLLGKKIGEIEERTGAKVAVVRSDSFLISPEEELQEGDYVVAIGPQADLQELTE